MIDIYEQERAALEAQADEIVRLIAGQYAGQIAHAGQRGDTRKAMELTRQGQQEVSRHIAPIAAALARLPMRPVLIDAAKLNPEQRKRLGL